MFNISSKMRTIIVGGIGVIYIIMGLSQALFNVKLDKSLTNNISFVLMAIAVVIFLGGKRGKTNSEETDTKTLGNKSEENISKKQDSHKDNK